MICDDCVHYDYDEETEDYVCLVNLDEDEIYRFMESGGNACPFYERYDEYGIVKKQN